MINPAALQHSLVYVLAYHEDTHPVQVSSALATGCKRRNKSDFLALPRIVVYAASLNGAMRIDLRNREGGGSAGVISLSEVHGIPQRIHRERPMLGDRKSFNAFGVVLYVKLSNSATECEKERT